MGPCRKAVNVFQIPVYSRRNGMMKSFMQMKPRPFVLMLVVRCSVILAAFVGIALADEKEALLPYGADEAVGTVYDIRLENLPDPASTTSVGNRPILISRPSGARLRAPRGFEVTLFADGLQHPRAMVVGADGAVFVAESNAGTITRLADTDGDGRADIIQPFASDFRLPSGIAIEKGDLYVADERAVWWLGKADGNSEAEGRRPITRAGAFGATGGHWTRMIRFSPDGRHLYVSIGSDGNLDEEPLPRASIQQFDLVNGEQRVFASGLRNPVGMALYPGSDRLFVVVNERDGMGDALVPDFLAEVTDGGFYGWPYAYLGPNKDPEFGNIRPDLVAAAITPGVLFAAHSAALDLVFYDGSQFPEKYRNGAFVSLHGSWNARTPTGYKVVWVPFENGQPTGKYETFVVGFWTEGQTPARVWGRPAGLATTRDGSLLVSDDAGGSIWRIRWRGDQ